MPNTYVALATQTVSSSTGITFSSIPSGYTDLVIVCNGVDSGGGYIRVRLNGDTGTNYSRTILRGNGTSAISARSSNDTAIFFDFITTNATVIANVMNYSNTTTFKPVLHRSNNSTDNVTANANLYRSTSAITTISLAAGDGGSTLTGTFSLYGIANADQGSAKATGGIITEDSTYWYHTFGASSAFIPKQSLTCDVLVVAGGGGGGNGLGSGGGAGGLFGWSSQALTATSYNVTVGAGGAGSTAASARGTNGVNSQFAALTASVGGGAGTGQSVGYPTGPGGASGGSGGGGSRNNTAAGSPTTGQGFAGGIGAGTVLGDVSGGGGGGGAGAVGANASSTLGGAGGIGVATYSSWGLAAGIGQNVSGTVYFAGGGGGANFSTTTTVQPGGSGGGGAGGTYTGSADIVPLAGSASTGGGGGGSATNGVNGASGGSGVVIVRYLKA